MPVLVAILSSLPCYMLLVQVAIGLVGLYEFTGAHGLRPGPLSPLRLVAAYLPYQWLLGLAAFRAVWRQARGVNTWEKTAHIGAHRGSMKYEARSVE